MLGVGPARAASEPARPAESGAEPTDGPTPQCMEVIMGSTSWLIVSLAVWGMTATGLGADPGDLDASAPASLRGATIRRVAFQRGRSAGGFSVRWIGQDGKDYVSPNNR